METESGDGGLTYRYSYGLQKENVVIYGIPNGAGSLLQKQTYPGGAQNIVKLYYHHDRLGSTDYLTDNIAGKVTSYATYDDFGELTAKAIVKMGVRMLDLVQEYTGHAYDQVLGLYYAKARMYDAQDRRFMAVDPFKGVITNPQTLILYAYVFNNPVLWVDPFGLNATKNPIELLKDIINDVRERHDDTEGRLIVFSEIKVLMQELGGVLLYGSSFPFVLLKITYSGVAAVINFPNQFPSKMPQTITPTVTKYSQNSESSKVVTGGKLTIIGNSVIGYFINLTELLEYFKKIWCEEDAPANTTPTRGKYKDFLDKLAMKESSDNYTARNGIYLGRYQLGDLALQDAGFKDSNNNWTELAKTAYNVNTNEAFLNNPQAQDAAIRSYHKKVWGYIKSYNLTKYIGQDATFNDEKLGFTVTESGLLAGSHLVGVGGARKFFNPQLTIGSVAVNKNGIPMDGNGTLITEYMKNYGGYDISEITN
jgi:RHS repeat-associated protein